MTETLTCQSCSMPIDNGHYGQYCTDSGGQLISFSTAFDRMTQFAQQKMGKADPAEARTSVLEFMSTMPAWKDHPDLLALRQKDD